MRVVNAATYVEPRDAISHDWIDWLAERGHDPVLMPNRAPDPARLLADSRAAALILTGGNDLVPSGEESGLVSEQRNANETALLEAAIERGLPLLGVCRGLHMVNAFCGGHVQPDIAGGPVDHVATTHPVRVSKILDDQTLITNSFHGQAVLDSGLGENLQAFAISEADHVVEGLCHTDLPMLAVQWHPERPGPSRAFDDALIERLFREGKFWR
jgi:putative glutamine amidotransferase